MKKRVLSFLLALIMVFSLMPSSAFAAKNEEVYISVSFDGQFIEDKNGNEVAYVAVPISNLATIDLEEYGLSDFKYDADGDGNFDITVLHFFIYVHENIFGKDFSEVRVSGGLGSIFFEAGLFGFEDCNLNYFYNGIYPEVNGWGVTADQLVLEAGDFVDVASYTSWAFYQDSATGFHFFADENGEFTHEYKVTTEEELEFKLVRSYSAMGSEAMVYEEPDYDVYYGEKIGEAKGKVTTDANGEGKVKFPSAGTWYMWCDGGYGFEYDEDIVSSPTSTIVTVEGDTKEEPQQPKDVSAILNATMAKLASTVTAPSFGTNAGEWTVLSLARGEYYPKDSDYFNEYYSRIEETVNETAASVSLQNGALHKSKSTDNSRLIVALSSIGKDATKVGNWNLITPYDDFKWIKNQGINGVIWALIALDTNDYQTTDATIRQQCIDYILQKQFEDGGWALSGKNADPDITAMTLQALYPYKNQAAVEEAAEKAFACLSAIQNEDGGYTSFGDANSESCAQVIVATTTWGINPATDVRFTKNGQTVLDALLTHYVEEKAAFKHVVAGDVNGMATDQACYALVSYNRYLNGKTALYDMSDVAFGEDVEITEDSPVATLGFPETISKTKGSTFNVTINLDRWDNEGAFKLIDYIMNIPNGLKVVNVTAGERLSDGIISYHQEEDGKLRVVFFDPNGHRDITLSGTEYPATFFTVSFEVEDLSANENIDINLSGMSMKRTSDSMNEDSMFVIDTTKASATIEVKEEVSYNAMCLYTGDNIDLIPSTKKAVAVAAVGMDEIGKFVYSDGTNEYEFKYSVEISDAIGVHTYVALVDATIDMTEFEDEKNISIDTEEEMISNLMFGDANNDQVVNAQDALAAVDAWLRKTDDPTDDEILAMNVNGDSRINTYDALGIVEAFVDGSKYIIITNAANWNVSN